MAVGRDRRVEHENKYERLNKHLDDVQREAKCRWLGALLGVFSAVNPTGFHTPGGAGYRLVADQVIELNSINPQMAARTVSAFNPWKRYDSVRRDLMGKELRRISAVEGLSADVAEIVSNALAD